MKVLQDKSQPLREDQQKILMSMVLSEMSKDDISEMMKEVNQIHLIQILKKRIEVLELPIKFNDYALGAILSFCDRPGAVVLLLIDCLQEYENEEVTVDKLVNLYPFGFYNEQAMIDRIDNEIKTGKSKWSEIY